MTPEPLAVCELNPGPLERPASQVACQRLLEALPGLGLLGDKSMCVSEDQRDPGARPLTHYRLDLRHPCPRAVEAVDVACRVGEVRDQPG